MQLFSSSLSPFARKCLIIARHLNLLEKIDIIKSMVHPIERNQTIVAKNPLGQIPTLVLSDETVIHDSRVICEFLNHIGHGDIFPKNEQRWHALTQQSLADGITDSAILIRYEQAIRPETYKWNDWIAGHMDKMNKGLAEFERTIATLENRFDIGTISLICTLDYISIRLPDFNWQADYPAVANWRKQFSAHPSVAPSSPQQP